MSTRDAAAALERLGLGSYEAEVFVALQQLGTGTTREISEVSDVPRSQVYGAADALAERGLVEVVESSPKAYRPVSLAAAREHLQRQLDREQERAFENLRELRTTEGDSDTTQAVSTLRGRQPVGERAASIVARAEELIIFVAPAAAQLSPAIAEALRDRATAGVEATLVTADPAVEEQFADDEVRVVLMAEDSPADYTGRTLMVDDDTVLLSVVTDDEPVDEMAMWTAETPIATILAQFVHSGMEAGMDQQDG
jgi:sugar-specific transcriptional regulator TrmB